MIRSTTLQRLFGELLDRKSFFLWNRRKCLGEIQKIFWKYLGSFVVLTVTINVITIQELFIKHHNNLRLRFTHYSSSETKWDVTSQRRIEVHDSVTYSKSINSRLGKVRPKPVWIVFLINIGYTNVL